MNLPDERFGRQARHRSDPASSITTVEDAGQLQADEPRSTLLLLFGSVAGERRSFELGSDPLLLGREVDHRHHVRLVDPRASRRHAEIQWSEVYERHWIRDLGSRNAILVNGARVAREFLEPGDLVRIGATIFCVRAGTPDGRRTGALQPPFVGASQSLWRSVDRASQVAASGAPVLILGPTGTGKELIARSIHQGSGRTGPLVAVNCAALPTHLVESELFGNVKGAFSGADSPRPGLFRAARHGTLFLDEIGELPPEVQAKLLRALDARSIRAVGATTEERVDVRLLSATNRDLAAEVRQGGFRADLYARLAELVVEVAPLRQRPEDLEPLWRHFVAELGGGATLELSGAAFEALALHAWPCNVRELRQLVRSALLLKPEGGVMAVGDLPAAMRPAKPTAPDRPDLSPSPSSALPLLVPGAVPSARQLRRLAEEFQGNVKDIAAFVGKDRKQIYRWLRRCQIDPDVYRKSDD